MPHLNKSGFASWDVMIKYHTGHKPSKEIKKKLKQAVDYAREALRGAVWELDKVFLFGQKSTNVADVLKTHFRFAALNEKDKADQKRMTKLRFRIKDFILRTSVMMTGTNYLLDVDAKNRKESDGSSMTGTEGYVNPQTFSILPAGPIHIDFDLCSTYSVVALARIIIHEATHRFCDTEDEAYAHEAGYKSLKPEQAANNADSYAYGVLSLYAKKNVDWSTLSAAKAH